MNNEKTVLNDIQPKNFTEAAEANIPNNDAKGEANDALTDDNQEEALNENSDATPKESKPASKSSKIGIIAAGAGLGVVLGTAGAYAATTALSANGEDAAEDNDPHDWIDEDIDIAESVSDDMSFNEAFAAARNEVGAGGAFEWKGNMYSTFSAEEWNSMSAEEKMEYDNHFHWDERGAETTNDSNDNMMAESQIVETETAETAETVVIETSEIVVETSEFVQEVVIETNGGDYMADGVEIAADGADSEIEVLGIEDTNALDCSDQEILLMEVDDYNADGEMSSDDDMEMFEDCADYAATDDSADYVNNVDDGGIML